MLSLAATFGISENLLIRGRTSSTSATVETHRSTTLQLVDCDSEGRFGVSMLLVRSTAGEDGGDDAAGGEGDGDPDGGGEYLLRLGKGAVRGDRLPRRSRPLAAPPSARDN
jgi:hypothetical protein